MTNTKRLKVQPLSDPSYILNVRKARRDYRCPADWAHDPTIKAGELYARIKITPGLGCGWREEVRHLECLDPHSGARP